MFTCKILKFWQDSENKNPRKSKCLKVKVKSESALSSYTTESGSEEEIVNTLIPLIFAAL